MPYFDMHCHLDFASNMHEAVYELNALGAGAFAVSVRTGITSHASSFVHQDIAPHSCSHETIAPSSSPSSPRVTIAPSSSPLLRWGVGLHPWWVADGGAAADLDAVLDAIPTHIYIGEVGLDFGKTHGENRDDQLAAFSAIARACGEVGGRVLSIHSVYAANEALDILQSAGALENCTCIFHWFSDSGEALSRAVTAGCYFSVGELMLRSARGREYARQLPVDRLLFETDFPAQGEAYNVLAMQDQLAHTCARIAASRGMEAVALAEVVEESSRRLLSYA